MEQVFTAVTISAFIMMGCALYVLIWDVLDNKEKKHLINLREDVYQEVIAFLNGEDKNSITILVNEAVLKYIMEK